MSFTKPLDKTEVDGLEATGAAVPPDWAESLTQANRAVRSLEDSFPRADQAAVWAAVLELEKSVSGFKSFLQFRGVTA
jgi:hypothetical protein